MKVFVGGIAFADVDYSVRAAPGQDNLAVTITFRSKLGMNAVEIPNWQPGGYNLSDNFNNIKNLAVTVDGAAVALQHPKNNRWEFSSAREGKTAVRYTVNSEKYTDRIHFSGPSTYLYVVDRKNEKCTLNLDLPKEWSAYTGLEATEGDRKYKAPTYDVLADCPVSAGMLTTASYTVRGVPHTIVVHHGPADKLDMAQLTAYCKYVSQAEGDFWGGLPFKKYVWHVNAFEARDGGSGLEHLNSVQLGVSTGMGLGLRSVLAHEYFHAWNVKRIRSKVLGPFDYNVLPKTGALWWLEGVTDYYASMFIARYGMAGPEYMGDQVGRNYSAYIGNTAHTTVSPYDSSYRVGEANGGRGNSSGYQISYYTLGWLVGFCLDTELRSRSNNKVSLDDVVKQLFVECNGKAGFEEGRIREILVEKGGAAMGVDYDEWVTKAGKLPVEGQLARLGLEIVQVEEPNYSFGLDTNANEAKTGLEVRTVLEPASAVLQKGDLITKVGEFSMAGVSTGQAARSLDRAANDKSLPATGRTVKFEVMRGGQKLTVDVPTRVTMRKASKVIDKALVTPDQRLLRTNLIYGLGPALKG